jgi:dolichol-phosphate mannosyltransferase
MDCDLQDKPEEIYKLYNKAQEGFEIVVASRENRQDDVVKMFLSNLFYKVLGYLTETTQDASIANFVIYERKAVDALARMNDHNRYYPMLSQMIGFNFAKVKIEHAEREDGESSYSLKKRLHLALNTILTFSDKPLRLTVKFGALITFLSICMTVVMVVLYLFSDVVVPGWSSILVLMSFFSGAIISVLGVVGLYVGRIFETVKNRPTYIIQDTINQ